MRYRLFALFLALTVASWAQTATPNTASTPQTGATEKEKAKCPCCDKMVSADAKDGQSCCAHHDMSANESKMDGKEMASCCKKAASDGKAGMACMRKAKGKAASCCKEGCGKESCARDVKDKTASACCGGKDGKGCCASKSAGKIAANCCRREMSS